MNDAASDPRGEATPRLHLEELLTQLIERAQETLHTQERLRGLLTANQAIVGDLDLPTVLRRIVEAACQLMDAQYGALGVIHPTGRGLEEFIYVGLTPEDEHRIGHLPEGKGLLGALIDDPRPIRLDHLGEDVRSVGFPSGHPPMESFLGVPIRVRDEVFGNLYLTQSHSGHFGADDQAVAESLAATAGVAIENARLFRDSRRRQDWLQASTEVTRHILTVADGQPLQRITDTVCRLAEADLVLLLVPEEDGSALRAAAVTGEAATGLGEALPASPRAVEAVLGEGEPLLVEDAAELGMDEPLLSSGRSLGPAILLPLPAGGHVGGVVLIGRDHRGRRFTHGDLEIATTFATHVALALELAEARRDQQRMVLIEDRMRIARDLHDHVIQQLFAAGMTVQGVAVGIDDPARARTLDKVVDRLDDAVKQIRTSIFQLGPRHHASVSLRAAVLEVVAELSAALGFDPRVSFTGPVDAVSDAAIAEDVLAVVREALTNTAKHARAGGATVRLHATSTTLDVRVEDDGIGLGEPARHSGLANLRARAEQRGGHLEVTGSPSGNGTSVEWSVPLG